MKKTILLACFIFGTLGAYCQTTWNLKAGAGLASLKGGSDDGEMSNSIAAKIGLGMEIPLNRNLNLMPSLEFAMKGGKWSNDDFYSISHEETFTAFYAQIPVLLGYRIYLGKNWNMVLKAGPYVAYGLFGKAKIENSYYSESGDFFGDTGFSRFDYGVEVGIDFECRRFVIGFDIEKGLREHEVGTCIKQDATFINIGFKL